MARSVAAYAATSLAPLLITTLGMNMTLIVSEVSKFGIAMTADSAVDEQYPSRWTLLSGIAAPPTIITGVQNLSQYNQSMLQFLFGDSEPLECPIKGSSLLLAHALSR